MTATALQPPPARSGATRKAVLFCQTCGHADRFDGEWSRTVTSKHERYECPECETTVIVQPRF